MLLFSKPVRRQPGKAAVGFWQRVYVKSAVGLLVLTALGKLLLATGNAVVLRQPDPVLGVLLRGEALLGAASLEIVVAGCVLSWGTGDLRSLAGLAWLATVFAVYRLTGWIAGVASPCDCLGSWAGVLGLSREMTENVSFGLFIYLLAGSYGLLAQMGWKARRALVDAQG